MATTVGAPTHARGDEGFFLGSALAMVGVLVAGFSMQLGAGRSSFDADWPIHGHAVTFFGWAFLYLLQTALVAGGRVSLHKRLGWLSLIWIPALVAVGAATITRMLRAGHVPFFFTPGYFLVMDMLALLAFAALAIAAVRMRRRTEWHRRLMFCAMAMLLGPGFGRLLPMPFLIPFAGLAANAPALLFPIAGMISDRRRVGRVHPAWAWGFGAMVSTLVVVETMGRGPIAAWLVRAITTGSPGAAVDPLGYPPPPGGPLITGR